MTLTQKKDSSRCKLGGKDMSNDNSIVTKTNDGYVVEVFAKTNTNKEVEKDVEGITILEPEKSLVEDEQYTTYKEIVEKMDYSPVIVKAPEMEKEIKVLKSQLRAMLRASKSGDLSILFSKIATIDELRQYKEILEDCKKELEEENTPYRNHIKIGIMVEIPAAAVTSYELGKECDFLFIDTNSLTNYTFGGKQDESKVKLAVIKLIQQAVEGAHDAGIFCGISGDMVENVSNIPLLLGLGIDQFSVDEKNIETIRNSIGELDKTECKYLVEEILQLRTTQDMENKLRKFNQN